MNISVGTDIWMISNINSTISNNNFSKIQFTDGSNITFIDNYVLSGASQNIFITGLENSTFTNNVIWNCSNCIYLSDSQSNVFDGNIINLSSLNAIFFNNLGNANSSNNIFKNTNITNNKGLAVNFSSNNYNFNHIFNLYFTTKAKGTGIGLSIVQRIIYEHSGIITVESMPGVSTTFYIRLPIHFKKI